ncbi:type ISP restriction/modification enzyme [Flexibacter flexilis]|nr:type ISP restriction/modification enzyme [Flexibacter flexilis]
MSQLFIQQYRTQLERVVKFGGSTNEMAIRQPFINLVNAYAEPQNLMLIAELTTHSHTQTAKIRPDGILKNMMKLDCGYWESKDSKDDLEKEIEAKIRKGYPLSNTVFEDSNTAILYQNNDRVLRVNMRDDAELDKLLQKFVKLELPYVQEFNKALEQFKTDIPKILDTFRELLKEKHHENAGFQQKFNAFWDSCKASINEGISKEDIDEMIIQHLLTSDLFTRVFDDADFHRENNIAQEIEQVISAFMNRETRMRYLKDIEYYYRALQDGAKHIYDHHDKQEFLKTVYENFYKVYNPKAADKLGVVYTPNEIVRFMLESTDYLLEKHFGRTMASKNVEILDPATGTGTFVANLIDYLPLANLPHKFKHEIHANEIAILPYYIANLNIEYTYKQRTGQYASFDNICLVDTLDNIDALAYESKQHSMFSMSSENTERIRRQNQRKISVIIGNPPYNAKQENYNFQNANRAYEAIDKRIKNTYIKYGTAQNQIVLYDMYVRFFRWASDRLDKNGVVSFVTNSSFIDAQSFDGFRKMAAQEFNEIYIIDLKGNARTSGEQRRKEGGNVFDDKIRVGVAVYFFVKNQEKTGCKIYYHAIHDYATSADKMEYMRVNKLHDLNKPDKWQFLQITPDAKHNWINQTDNDWESLLPLCDKNVKAGKGGEAVFKLFSSGIKSQRDEWVYDFNKENLSHKMQFFADTYTQTLANPHNPQKMAIKWDADLESYLNRKIAKQFEPAQMVRSLYRPFSKMWFYFDKHFNGRTYQWFNIYNAAEQSIIAVPGIGSPKEFYCIGLKDIIDLNAMPAGGQCLPLYTYDAQGKQVDNITNWALEQFRARYGAENIQKIDIFHYVYAVLHHPRYRSQYEQNLKRDFPRLPFYEDFGQWVAWGKALLDWHINYENAAPYALQRTDVMPKPKKQKDNALFADPTVEPLFETPRPTLAPKAKLKAIKELGEIQLDEQTKLSGIPAAAWDYKLGNRSALEWILDQYKESTPSDPTIRDKFNTYRFADYKEQVIELLQKVCTVSVETMRIIGQMPA